MNLNLTCNATLEGMRIVDGSERPIAGSLTFHQLALIIGGGTTIISIILSFYLIWMHALNYTKPSEQKHIIRILFMVPIYAVSSFLQIRFYWHAVYYQVISDCYEAFAISSFFALLCHYLAPDLHEQKEFFRHMQPIKPWVMPVSWFRACCGGQRGPWRTPRSGLTWFNIAWVGIYQYCFIRVAMTITAVVTQYFGRYCESSDSPAFAHIWVTAINCVAVTIAMYCVIQFYFQLKEPLAEHQPFRKVLAIKLVIFLSFWQTIAISVGTSNSIHIVHTNAVIAYPDIKVGIPALLLCVEMAFFALLHIWAFPYRPYTRRNTKVTFYPAPSPDSSIPPRESERGPPAGGFMGLRALWDAANVWDVAKAFGRGVRWLFVGVKRRQEDVSYHGTGKGPAAVDLDDMAAQSPSPPPGPARGGRAPADPFDVDTAYGGAPHAAALYDGRPPARGADGLPIATEFRRSRFDARGAGAPAGAGLATTGDIGDGRMPPPPLEDESAALIAHAQPNPASPERYPQRPSPPPAQQQQQQRYYDPTGVAAEAGGYYGQQQQQWQQQQWQQQQQQGRGGGPGGGHPYYGAPGQAEWQAAQAQAQAPGGNPRNSRQALVGQALWGMPPGGGGGGDGAGGSGAGPGGMGRAI